MHFCPDTGDPFEQDFIFSLGFCNEGGNAAKFLADAGLVRIAGSADFACRSAGAGGLLPRLPAANQRGLTPPAFIGPSVHARA